MTINNEEKYLENEVNANNTRNTNNANNANNTGNTSNQLCQSLKLWQSVYCKSDVLRLLGGFGRKRKGSEEG